MCHGNSDITKLNCSKMMALEEEPLKVRYTLGIFGFLFPSNLSVMTWGFRDGTLSYHLK